MDKKGTILNMRKMNIEEKIAMLSDKDEAYVRGFIEGTLYWSCQMVQKNGGGKAVIRTKQKSPKIEKKAGKSI